VTAPFTDDYSWTRDNAASPGPLAHEKIAG
jgi:hypothetical protein